MSLVIYIALGIVLGGFLINLPARYDAWRADRITIKAARWAVQYERKRQRAIQHNAREERFNAMAERFNKRWAWLGLRLF